MDKKQKENIKRVVSEGLTLIKTRLQISKPSSKLESALKKHSRKLIDDLKKEVKKKSKKQAKNNTKIKAVKKPRKIKVVSKKAIK